MSQPVILQDATGIAISVPGHGHLLAWGTTAPTDSLAGYASGCIYIHTDGAADDQLFINEGDIDSTTWTVVGSVG